MARKKKTPSLLEPEARGGDVADSGLCFQEQVTLAYLPSWLAHDGFTAMIREAIGDTEAKFFVPGRGFAVDLLEVKNHTLTPAAFWREIERFQRLDAGAPGAYRRFTLACAGLSELLHPFYHGLTSGVVHDFNNLLTGIAGFAELGLHALPSEHASREDLEEIRAIAARAAALTNHLLAFARKQPTEPRKIELNDLLRNLDKLLHWLLGADIELVSLIAPDLGWVTADPGHIEQVLVNLAINARDAMPHGGTLLIAAANVTLHAGQGHAHADCVPGEYVLLTVSDTGMGMGATIQARLFEPFFTTKSREHGTGLGLSTCYRIIRQYRGDIRIASAPWHGTTVSTYLPRIAAIDTDAPTIPLPLTAELPRGTETVLVVEDEATVRAVAARILCDLGYIVLEATGRISCGLADDLSTLLLIVYNDRSIV